MTTIEDQIPAFSMWKMFNETMRYLLRGGSPDNMKRLANTIIQSKEFSNLFVYFKDPSISFEQYQEVISKYKSFTVWLLGHFFYLLSCDKLRQIHDVIVDAQLCILEKLSNSTVHVYAELSNEYCKSFSSLVEFCANANAEMELQVFIPVQHSDLGEKLDLSPVTITLTSKASAQSLILKMLKFIGFILSENFAFYSFDDYTYKTLDSLIQLSSLQTSNKIVIEVTEITVTILEKFQLHLTAKDVEDAALMKKMRRLSSFFEQNIYDVYNCNLKFDEDEFVLFEVQVLRFLNVKSTESATLKRVIEFVHLQGFDNCKISEQIQLKCARNYELKCICPVKLERLVHNYAHILMHSLKSQLLSELRDYCEKNPKEKRIALYEVSTTWAQFQSILLEKLNAIGATNPMAQCELKQFIIFFNNISAVLMEIQIEMKKAQIQVGFFDESAIYCQLITKLNNHSDICCNENFKDNEDVLQYFLNYFALSNPETVDIIFHIVAYSFVRFNQLPVNFIARNSNMDVLQLKKITRSFYDVFLVREGYTNHVCLKFVNKFLALLASGLFEDLNCTHLSLIQLVYGQITSAVMGVTDEKLLSMMAEPLPNILTIFTNSDEILHKLLIPLLKSDNPTIELKLLEILPSLLCTTSNDYKKCVQIVDNQLTTRIICPKCCDDQSAATSINFSKSLIDFSLIGRPILKMVLGILIRTNAPSVKVEVLKIMPYVASHVSNDDISVTTWWARMVDNPHIEVRLALAKYLPGIIKQYDDDTKMMGIIFEEIKKTAKKALQNRNFDLQLSTFKTIEPMFVHSRPSLFVQINALEILIYYVMTPTSKYSVNAVEQCFKLANHYDVNTNAIYKTHRQKICEVVVHLCVVNMGVIQYSLQTSLMRMSVMLGFLGVKDFVVQEYGYLLPYLIMKINKFPEMDVLMEELASLVELDPVEILVSKYGNVFLHLFLNREDQTEFYAAMRYMERATKMSGADLMKLNFRVLLNELLLNFNEQRDRVLEALTLLTKGDIKDKSLPDYLQSHFLGILLHFDTKLIAKAGDEDKILKSLADFLRFMGPKQIVPLRFKIIAMLQTAKCAADLHCEVWDAFICSCDVEFLGPQLATIFVSILPLLADNSDKINSIFKYLIVENEDVLKEFIPDLFFVNSTSDVDYIVIHTIKRHIKSVEDGDLKTKIAWFLKYSTHESMEVRVHALKHLKLYMEQGRKELDQMILGYNGIDQCIVDLIDMLTVGCRVKDDNLKLACAEVFGELGAVEPSHLPRRYAQDSNTFAFFMHEDNFVTNALIALLSSFQTEQNTQNMDRFALAIQELLKTYDITPEVSSAKYHLWSQFTEAQREVMLPLLSSKYTISQQFQTNFDIPIYGSSIGATVADWLYNWTCSLVFTLPIERKELLQMILPSMKKDVRVLKQFLPHILLHAILEGRSNAKKCYTELQTVINACEEQEQTANRKLNIRPLPISGMTVTQNAITPNQVKRSECRKVVFLLLDFLDRWLREWRWQEGLVGLQSDHFKAIQNFLNDFDKLQLAKCNYECGEYPRALMYLESHFSGNPDDVQNHLGFLTEIYAQLYEIDSVAGVATLQVTEPSIEQSILSLEVSGKLADAASCYERMSKPLKGFHLQGLIQCYLDLDNLNSALYIARGGLDEEIDFGNMSPELLAEPLWRLGRFDELDDLLKKPELQQSKTWGVQIGKALLHFQNNERNAFKSVVDGLRMLEVESFGAASLEEGAYQYGYGCISRLHSLNELERFEKALNDLMLKANDSDTVENIMQAVAREWELRIQVVQESIRVIEPLLCIRRVALDLGRRIAQEKVPSAVPHFEKMLGEYWLLSAATARVAGVHQQAYTYTVKAEEYAPDKLFLEKAKLHWLREDHELALTTLKRGLETISPDLRHDKLPLDKKKIFAEAKLLFASYNDEMSNVDTESNIHYYTESYEAFKEWEKSLVCLAQYFDRVYQSLTDADRDKKNGSDIQIYIINYFGKSMQYGTTYVYQSMPRLLSIWFDYGTRLLDVVTSTTKEERKNNLLKMTKLIDTFLERLPSYIFLTAFSQLVSRICHPQREVYVELKSIIIKLLQQYPQQSLWMIISVIKSSYAIRSKRCAEILSDDRLRSSSMTKLVRDFTALAERLIELCNKEIVKESDKTSVNSLLRVLPRMLSKSDFSEIMMPTHKFRKLILPNPEFTISQHNPFPNRYVHIIGIDDEMTILESLQHPRKISLRGSDGKKYIYMLKPKDDLRKDFRLMEFNDIVNQLLAREPEALQRRLNIRLYSVAPLNEECGLIEWVPNLVGLRPVLQKLYKQRGLGMNKKELLQACCNIQDPLAKKLDIFNKVLLRKYPPVLPDWFRKHFPDAQSWLTARTAFTRTTAVMSMAGYILGLGDRHGENILLDSTCGDVVHVDFNCLFNKGETFEWPERVPFRLTQNMVAAMGSLGVEGVFRKSCVCALKVLRNNQNTLMSIVTPFVYDPLVSWPRNVQASSYMNAERTNEQALEHIKNIKLRLQGTLKSRGRSLSIPLSIDGQANNLIHEAKRAENLCQMYMGWGPHL